MPTDLPPEIWVQIASYLSFADHLSLQSTSRRLRTISRPPHTFNAFHGTQPFTSLGLFHFISDLIFELEYDLSIVARTKPPTGSRPWYARLPRLTPCRITHKRLLTFGSDPAADNGLVWRLQVLVTATLEHRPGLPRRVHLRVKWLACRQLPLWTGLRRVQQLAGRTVLRPVVSPEPYAGEELEALNERVMRQEVMTWNSLQESDRRRGKMSGGIEVSEKLREVVERGGGYKGWWRKLRQRKGYEKVWWEFLKCHCVTILERRSAGRDVWHTFNAMDWQNAVEWVEANWTTSQVYGPKTSVWLLKSLDWVMREVNDCAEIPVQPVV